MYSKAQRGFTLVETILYIALFTIVVGGGIMAAFQLMQSGSGTEHATTAEAEGNFLMRKLDWAITGARATSSPPQGATSTSLMLSRDGVTYVFSFSGDFLTLAQNGGPAIPLNTVNAPASTVVFRHIGGSPEGIEFTFFLNQKQFGPKTRYLR